MLHLFPIHIFQFSAVKQCYNVAEMLHQFCAAGEKNVIFRARQRPNTSKIECWERRRRKKIRFFGRAKGQTRLKLNVGSAAGGKILIFRARQGPTKSNIECWERRRRKKSDFSHQGPNTSKIECWERRRRKNFDFSGAPRANQV